MTGTNFVRAWVPGILNRNDELTSHLPGDLRDRHKRRCARSSHKVKLSKRKSCSACCQSKLGCDLGTPACSRCVGRGTTCEYAVPPPSALSSATARPPNILTGAPTSQSCEQNGQGPSPYAKKSMGMRYHTSHPNPADLPSLSVPHSAASSYPTPTTPDSFMMPLDDSYDSYQPFNLLYYLKNSQPFLPNDPQTPTSGSCPSAGFDAPEFEHFVSHDNPSHFSDWYQDSSVSPSFLPQQNQISGPWQTYSSDRHVAEMDQMNYPHRASMDSHSPFSLFNALGLPANNPANNSSVSPAHSTNFGDANSTFLAIPGRQYELSSSTADDSYQDSPIVSEISEFASESWRGPYPPRAKGMPGPARLPSVGFFDLQSLVSLAATANPKAAPEAILGDMDLIRLVQSYPSMMLQRTYYPPFVHHTLYRDHDGEVAGPMANALYCVDACTTIAPGSESFVYNMINTERERLVRGFHSWSWFDINALDVLHTMCVYQIVGLLNNKDATQARNAELQHPPFLKMAGRLCQEYLQSDTSKDENSDWDTWVIAETLRRTLFLVNIVNTLSRRTHAQNPSCYNALDESLIFNLALPAPDPMWKACTAGEWELAKVKLGWDVRTQRTIHSVMERLGEGHSDDENRRWFGDFQPLSLLIIACVRLYL